MSQVNTPGDVIRHARPEHADLTLAGDIG